MEVKPPHTLLALLTLPILLKHCLHKAYMPTYIAILYMDRALWNYGCINLWALEQELGRNGLFINPFDCCDY